MATDIAGYGIFGLAGSVPPASQASWLRTLQNGIFDLAGSVQSRNNRSETESELSDIKVYTIDVIFG